MNAPATDDAMVGRVVLGRYRILRHLADGGMGAIYLARNEGSAGFVRPVVIKWVLPSHSGDKRITDLFMREARIMAKLTHPDIVSVLDFAEEDGMYIMALEYVHGFTLGRWAHFIKHTRGPFPADIAVQIAIKVLNALEYAHTLKGDDGEPLKIVHRDVTPSNVLIDTQGHIKLADFGVAGIASEKTQVGDNTVKGKFAYLPPESFDRVPASAVTDVYSTAMMLHEILLGQNEFACDTMGETVGRVIKHVATRVDVARSDVSPGIADVIEKGLAKNPKERYQSAAAFASALAAVRFENETEVAARLKELASTDFFDARLAQMSAMPGLSELESAWKTPLPADAPARVSTQMRAPTAPARSETAGSIQMPAAGGSRSNTLLLGLILGVLVLGGVGAAVWFLVLNKQSGPEDKAYIVVDERGTTTVTADAASGAPPIDAAEGSAAQGVVDAGSKPVTNDPPRPPPPRPPPSEPDSNQLTKAFGRKASAVTACFRQHPSDVTDVSIRFRIDTAGKVESAELLPASLTGTALGKCLDGVARSTKFGPQAKAVTFRVPLQAKTE